MVLTSGVCALNFTYPLYALSGLLFGMSTFLLWYWGENARRKKRHKGFVELCDSLARCTTTFLSVYAHLPEAERAKLWEPVMELAWQSSFACELGLDPRP